MKVADMLSTFVMDWWPEAVAKPRQSVYKRGPKGKWKARKKGKAQRLARRKNR